MKKKNYLLAGSLVLLLVLLPSSRAGAQVIGLKTNALAWGAYGTLNLGAEVGFAKRWTFELDGAYNPFTHSDHKKTHMWALQGEFRYWFRYKFAGHFIGLHGHYGEYDWGVKKYRYKGDMFGGGISYGYSYMLGKRWSIEGNIGFGLTHLGRDYKYDRKDARITYPIKDKDYWGPSRAGISITYFIK